MLMFSYGNPSQSEAVYNAFSKHFYENYAIRILEIFIVQSESSITHGAYLSPRVKQLILAYITTACVLSCFLSTVAIGVCLNAGCTGIV
jgi:hypothetical protein